MHYHPIKTLKQKGPTSLKRNSTGTYFDWKSSCITWNCIKLEDIEKRLKNQDLKVKTTQRVYSAQSPILSGTIQIYLIMYDLVKYRWKLLPFCRKNKKAASELCGSSRAYYCLYTGILFEMLEKVDLFIILVLVFFVFFVLLLFCIRSQNVCVLLRNFAFARKTFEFIAIKHKISKKAKVL